MFIIFLYLAKNNLQRMNSAGLNFLFVQFDFAVE